MSIKSVIKGDIVHIKYKDDFIGIVRYIGPVNNLSQDYNDEYIGIEIQIKRNPNSHGNTTGEPYFKTAHKYGLFVKEEHIIRKYTAAHLLQVIQTQIPPEKINKELFPPITDDGNAHGNQNHNNNNNFNISQDDIKINDNNNNNNEAPDLNRLRTQLSIHMDDNEISTLISYCENEGYDDLETIQCDIDEYDIKENSSMIVDHMRNKYNWNGNKQQQFVSTVAKAVENANGVHINEEKAEPQPIPQQQSQQKPYINPPPQPQPPQPISQKPIANNLPSIYDFKIPIDILRQRDKRNSDAIISCFKKNKIPNKYTERLRKFLRDNKIYSFSQLQNSNVLITFTSMNTELNIFSTYVSKCIYELSPPMFLQRKITKKDEKECKALLDEQCAGLIKHDKPLIHFILLTQFTSPELPSEIVDIADRIFLETKRKLTKKEFANKDFFEQIDIKQKSTVSLGMTHYHHRFLPEFPLKPIKFIVDKISGYQKYCILLSHVTNSICNYNNSNRNDSVFNFSITRGWEVEHKNNSQNGTIGGNNSIGCVPLMIDLMIIPPGCQDRVEDLRYDANGPNNTVNDIEMNLRNFNIKFECIQGLKGKYNNFDEGIGRRIGKKIVNAIKKLTDGFNKSHQRICIVIDRRWRINCKNEWIGYDKLRKQINKNNLNNKWYKQNSDQIFVYSPKLIGKRQSYNEFKSNYIHETLLYLTKTCIIPSKNGQPIGGDTPDGWVFNISVHIEQSVQPKFYKYNQRWYMFLQGAAIRFFPNDMVKLWPNYFAHCDEDKGWMDEKQINKQFKIDLTESDCSYKRWYCAIKRSN